jgi:hypothetical protein
VRRDRRPEIVVSTTIVTFSAERAEAALARFVAWAGETETEDLGVLDGRRRYRVDAALWSAYVRAAAPR